MNTQNNVDAPNRGLATQRPEENIRVPTVGEHMLRVFGFNRDQSLYGIEGDRLAARYPEKGWTWALGYAEPIPLFLEQSRQNQMKAYCLLIAIAISSLFLVIVFLRSDSRDVSAQHAPPAELSPAERLFMTTVQQQLGVSNKAMQDYYAPPAQQQPPATVEEPAATQQLGAPSQQHHPRSMRTFGLRAQRQQAPMPQQQYAMPMPQQQYAMPMPQQQYAMPMQQQQYATPAQEAQPQRMQVYVSR
jgi:hypothetical protein